MLVLLSLLLFVAVPFVSSAAVATPIPFGGIVPPPPATYTVGQLITQVSDVSSFSFYVLSYGPAGGAGTATVYLWSGSAPSGSALASVPVTFSAAPGSYGLVSVPLSLQLNPTATYLIALTFPTVNSQYVVATTPAAAGSSGGYVDNISGAWSTGSGKNVLFGIATQNLLPVNPATNFAQGPGGGGWSCNVQTTYSKIQVNWQTLQVNSALKTFGTSTLKLGAASCLSFKAPYGTTANCGYSPAVAGSIDLTGTSFKVADTFVAGGYLPNGGAAVFSNNNQVVSFSGGGDCGYDTTPACLAAGEQACIVDGGFFPPISYCVNFLM